MTPFRPSHYRSAAIFGEETARLFDREWHLAALAGDLAQPDDYRVIAIAGREIVVQNSGGTLHAFSNVCPHRFNALRTAAAGNAPLRCSYHLWSFGADGLPATVPHRGAMPLDVCRQEGLALDRWQVERCGGFLFVAYRPRQPLAVALGALSGTLETISAALGDEIWSFAQVIEANWKIILQNTVEFDHAFSVHPETFAPLVERPLTLVDAEVPAPHIAYRTIMRRDPATRPAARRIEALFQRVALPAEPGYRHILLFPGTTFGSTDNRHIAITHYRPIDARHSQAVYRVFSPRIDGLSLAERAMLKAAVDHDLGFIQRLLDEDRAICEQVQRGIDSAPAEMAGILLPGESLVGRFREYYAARMDD